MSNYPGALSGGFVSHRFQSLKSDQPDLSVINPSNWNQSHIIGSGAIQSGALGASMVNSGNITALAVTSGAIASGATSWNLFGPSKPFVTVTPNGPTDGGDYGPNTVGTTTAGIQEAINSLATAGGCVYLTPGTYTISNTIFPKSNTVLRGPGNGILLEGADVVAIIKAAASMNKDIISAGSGPLVTSVIIDGLMIDGTKASNTAGHGINLNWAKAWSLRNFQVINAAKDGVHNDSAGGNSNAIFHTLANFYINNCGNDGVHCEISNSLTEIILGVSDDNAGIGFNLGSLYSCDLAFLSSGGCVNAFYFHGGSFIRANGLWCETSKYEGFVASTCQQSNFDNVYTRLCRQTAGSSPTTGTSTAYDIYIGTCGAITMNAPHVYNTLNGCLGIFISTSSGGGYGDAIVVNGGTVTETGTGAAAFYVGTAGTGQVRIRGLNKYVTGAGPYNSNGYGIEWGAVQYVRLDDCPGLTPIGQFGNPFGTDGTNNRIGLVAGAGSSLPTSTFATPASGTFYTVVGTDLMVTSLSGGGISLSLSDAAGNTIANGLLTLTAKTVKVGQKLNWGSYTSGPTVTVAGI